MKTILLVDDEFALSETLKEFLQDEGYSAQCAGNGKEALEAMAKHPPDLVVSDMMMPIIDGYSMLRSMRADPALKAIPVILMSSVRQRVVFSRDPSPDLSGFLHKPFRLSEFLGLVVKLIGPGPAGS